MGSKQSIWHLNRGDFKDRGKGTEEIYNGLDQDCNFGDQNIT